MGRDTPTPAGRIFAVVLAIQEARIGSSAREITARSQRQPYDHGWSSWTGLSTCAWNPLRMWAGGGLCSVPAGRASFTANDILLFFRNRVGPRVRTAGGVAFPVYVLVVDLSYQAVIYAQGLFHHVSRA